MLEKEIQDNIVIATLTDGASNAVTIETLRQLKEIIDEVNEKDAIKRHSSRNPNSKKSSRYGGNKLFQTGQQGLQLADSLTVSQCCVRSAGASGRCGHNR